MLKSTCELTRMDNIQNEFIWEKIGAASIAAKIKERHV